MSTLTSFLLTLPAIVIAIGFHEAAHAFVAYQLGDNTARNEGRLTINPLKHIDPLGIIMLIVFKFGWAKPVPINPNNFKNKKWGTVLTSLAGPVTNLIIAFIFCVIYILARVFMKGPLSIVGTFLAMVEAVIAINIGLAVFNFIPIPPLDGSKVLFALLPNKYYYKFLENQSIIQIILIFLMFSGIIGRMILPITSYLYSLFLNLGYSLLF